MKPVVKFVGAPAFFHVDGGEVAYVYALDHPTLGEQKVRTSLVQEKHENGSFETLNTLYVPDND